MKNIIAVGGIENDVHQSQHSHKTTVRKLQETEMKLATKVKEV